MTDKPDHLIEMRMPNGGKSTIKVFHKDGGAADIVFARSSQGEILVQLPQYAVARLAEALQKSDGGVDGHAERPWPSSEPVETTDRAMGSAVRGSAAGIKPGPSGTITEAMVECAAEALAGHFGPQFSQLPEDKNERRQLLLRHGQPFDHSKADVRAAARDAIQAALFVTSEARS